MPPLIKSTSEVTIIDTHVLAGEEPEGEEDMQNALVKCLKDEI